MVTIARLSAQDDAVATVWLEQTNTGLTLLHLVAMDTGQALVRIIEAPSSTGAVLKLALVAQELLGQSYLLSDTPRNAAVESVVSKLAQEAVMNLEDPKPVVDKLVHSQSNEARVFSLSPLAAVRGGAANYKGNSILVGGGLAVDFRPMEQLFLRASVLALPGIIQKEPWGTLSVFSVQPSLGIGYLWRKNWFQWGPMLQAAAVWYKVDVFHELSGDNRHSSWTFRGSLDLQLRAVLSSTTYLALSPGLGAFTTSKRFYLSPEGETVYRSPRLDWSVSLEWGFFIF